MVSERNEALERLMNDQTNRRRGGETQEIRRMPLILDGLLILAASLTKFDARKCREREDLHPEWKEEVRQVRGEDQGVPGSRVSCEANLAFIPELRLRDHFVVLLRGDVLRRFQPNQRHAELRIVQFRFFTRSFLTLIDRMSENDEEGRRRRKKNKWIPEECPEVRTTTTDRPVTGENPTRLDIQVTQL